MAEPLDHQIVEAIASLLRTIRKSAGFRTDAGEYVLSEEEHDEIPEDATVLEVLDDEETSESQNCRRRKAVLALTIAVNYPAQEVDQALRRDVRRILADIRQALAGVQVLTWLPGLTGLEIVGRSLFIREAGSRYFRPELRLRATFNEDHRSNS